MHFMFTYLTHDHHGYYVKNCTNCKLLLIQKKLDSLVKLDDTPVFLSQKSVKEWHFYFMSSCKHGSIKPRCNTQALCKWTAKPGRNKNGKI